MIFCSPFLGPCPDAGLAEVYAGPDKNISADYLIRMLRKSEPLCNLSYWPVSELDNWMKTDLAPVKSGKAVETL